MGGAFSKWVACVACFAALGWCAACERAMDRTCDNATTTIQLRTLANPDAMDDDDVERIVDNEGDLDHMPGHDWLLLYDDFSWMAYDVDPTDVFGDGSGTSDAIGTIEADYPGWRILAMREDGDLYVLAREIERCDAVNKDEGGNDDEITAVHLDVASAMLMQDTFGRPVPGVVVCERSMPCLRKLWADQRGRPVAILHDDEDMALSIGWFSDMLTNEWYFSGLFPLDVAQDVVRKLN